MDLNYLALVEAADLITKKVISSEELTQAHLDRISKLDTSLNCFISLTPETALKRARWNPNRVKGSLRDAGYSHHGRVTLLQRLGTRS
jgi:aspartyl-tRNA(Asn)/glutamyl-tRNA(Gln) amidotransferase subunit A